MLELGYWMLSSKAIALILSAGASKRFGSHKALAKFKGETFLDIITSKCLSLNLSVFAVINSDLHHLINPERLFTTIIGDSKLDMYDSIIKGIEEIKDFDNIIIWPIDHPLVKESTIEEMLKFRSNSKFIIPAYKQKLGHPIIMPKLALQYLKISETLKDLTKTCEREIITVNDPGILKNINRKEDLIDNEKLL